GDRIGDVVELEVEEDPGAAGLGNAANAVRAVGAIEFEAELDAADGRGELRAHPRGPGEIGGVEGAEDAPDRSGLGHGAGLIADRIRRGYRPGQGWSRGAGPEPSAAFERELGRG